MASELSNFDKFCGNSPFWNDTLFLHSPYPHFTECFKQVVLQWIPCLLLLVTSVPYVCYVYGECDKPIKAGWLAVAKTGCSFLLLAITIATLIVRATDNDQDSIPDALYVSEGLKTACFILTTAIIQLDRRKGYVRSPLLWGFWFFILVCSIVPFYSNIEENVQDDDMFGFVIFYVYFALVLLSFIFSSLVELPPRVSYVADGSREEILSPELVASVPSILSIFWLSGLIYKGYKKPLEEKDIFDSNPKDLLESTAPVFERVWKQEEYKVKKYNSTHRPPPDVKASSSAMKKVDEKTPLIPPGMLGQKDKLDGKSSLFPPKPKANESLSWKKKVSLFKVIIKAYWHYFLISQIIITSCDIIKFITPALTEAILNFILYRSSYPEWQGYALAASFAVVLTISSVGTQLGSLIARRAGVRVRGVLMYTIYKKSLAIGNKSDDLTTGQIVNLMAIDCQNIEALAQYAYVFLSAPFQIALAIYMLWEKLELATLAGLGVLLLALPLNIITGRILGRTQIMQMRLKDKRVKMTTEILNGVKVLKLYAWEHSFEKKIEGIRKEELKVIKTSRRAIAVIFYIFTALPTLVQIVAFAVYIAISADGYLSPVVASVSMQLFSLLNLPLTIVPLVFPQAVQAKVSADRISKYLNEDEIPPDIVEHDETADNAVEIRNGEFSWDPMQKSTLRDINLALKPGSLVAVVGMVGSGKSSLLSAIMGEMNKINGKVTLKDSLAYVPQEAWIQNETLKNNILFGSHYNRKKYNKIIEACALKSDLEILPGGDKTEIGEKGINISGGQKQRISLARAVYSDNQIYLLDDPLSAVDSHVGKHIFTHVISDKGVLKNKTRILVTHGIHWLPMVDNIIVMLDGQISEIGTYEELMSRDGAFAQFLIEHTKEEVASDDEEKPDPEVESMKQKVLQRLASVTSSAKDGDTSADDLYGAERRKKKKSFSSSQQLRRRRISRTPSQQGDSNDLEENIRRMSMAGHSSEFTESVMHVPEEKLIQDESKEVGKVKWSVYWYYLSIYGMGMIILSVLLNICSAVMTFFTGIWLGMWTSDSLLANTSRSGEDEYESKTVTYMAVYGVSGVLQGVFLLIFALLLAVKQTSVAGVVHKRLDKYWRNQDQLYNNREPITTGRCKDISEDVDKMVLLPLQDFRLLTNVLRLPMSFFDTTPIGRILNRFSQDIEIIDNMLPMNLRQILMGLTRILGNIATIAFGTPIFLVALVPLGIIYLVICMIFVPASRQLRRLVSVSKSPIFNHFSETLSGVTSIRAYRCKDRFLNESKERVDHNMRFYLINTIAQIWISLWLQLLGNMIVFAAAIFTVATPSIDAGIAGVSISYATTITGSLQMIVNCMSQMENNLVSVERIKEYICERREADWINHCHRPVSDWPQDGEVIFKNYQTRYRPGLDLVLKDISCQINGGEKIGIVGRTGAGKSSMTVALFRIIEAVGGQIMIDDEDIASMGLHDLRKKLTILPQDPIIFSGSIRMNLDPFSESSDNALWDALERSYMKDFVQGLPTGLSYECGEGGSNLSVGQRQLLCLGRTLLRKTKILVLDEATAAIDMETDELIQETIREEFKDSTVLTIAHRLNTIMDYDRIMVLDQGGIKEFDTPRNLLDDKSTVFYSMAKSAGLAS